MNRGNSSEMYLKEIYFLSKCVTKVRITDVANAMGVSKASASYAVKNLCKKGLLRHKLYGNIEITKEGIARGRLLYKKQTVIADYFAKFLDISTDDANTEASDLYHIISDEAVEKMSEWLSRKENTEK